MTTRTTHRRSDPPRPCRPPRYASRPSGYASRPFRHAKALGDQSLVAAQRRQLTTPPAPAVMRKPAALPLRPRPPNPDEPAIAAQGQHHPSTTVPALPHSGETNPATATHRARNQYRPPAAPESIVAAQQRHRAFARPSTHKSDGCLCRSTATTAPEPAHTTQRQHHPSATVPALPYSGNNHPRTAIHLAREPASAESPSRVDRCRPTTTAHRAVHSPSIRKSDGCLCRSTATSTGLTEPAIAAQRRPPPWTAIHPGVGNRQRPPDTRESLVAAQRQQHGRRTRVPYRPNKWA